MRKLILAVTAALFASQAAAQQPPPPRLLVVISVDQLSAELFDEYRPQFSGGLAELASGTLFRNASASAAQGPTIGELMKAHWPGSRNVAVAGARASADAMSGRSVDQRWYWAGSRFETDVPGAAVPRVLPKLNAAVAAALAQPRPPLQPPPSCQSKAKPAGNRLARAAGDAAALGASPELDGDTLALAAALVDERQLGRRADPDVLAIGLSATGNVARAHGAQSEELCLQLTELDREIGDFLSLLDSRGVDYAVALEGSGAARVPIIFWRPGFRGATVNTPVDSADIVPTLAALVALPLPAGAAPGHCLEGTPAFCPQR